MGGLNRCWMRVAYWGFGSVKEEWDWSQTDQSKCKSDRPLLSTSPCLRWIEEGHKVCGPVAVYASILFDVYSVYKRHWNNRTSMGLELRQDQVSRSYPWVKTADIKPVRWSGATSALFEIENTYLPCYSSAFCSQAGLYALALPPC